LIVTNCNTCRRP
jgi:phosphohistidine swiveling domain-containing protein